MPICYLKLSHDHFVPLAINSLFPLVPPFDMIDVRYRQRCFREAVVTRLCNEVTENLPAGRCSRAACRHTAVRCGPLRSVSASNGLASIVYNLLPANTSAGICILHELLYGATSPPTLSWLSRKCGGLDVSPAHQFSSCQTICSFFSEQFFFVTPVENSTGYLINFFLYDLSHYYLPLLSPVFLSSPTYYRMVLRGRSLPHLPPITPTNNQW
jgi:hypothetical protein